MSIGVDDSLDLQAARLELIVLGAIAGRADHAASANFALEPDSTPASFDATAGVIAGMPKPLSCKARLEREVLRVDCRQVVGDSLRRHGLYISAMNPEGRYPSGGPQRMLLILAGHDQVLLPSGVVGRWYRDYSLPPDVAFSTRDPNAQEQSFGASEVLIIGKLEPISRDTLVRLLRVHDPLEK